MKTGHSFQEKGEKRGEKIYCSVEELVREYHKDEMDFPYGLHGEGKMKLICQRATRFMDETNVHSTIVGSVVSSICGLLFWDIIYDGTIPDAFRSPQQRKDMLPRVINLYTCQYFKTTCHKILKTTCSQDTLVIRF